MLRGNALGFQLLDPRFKSQILLLSLALAQLVTEGKEPNIKESETGKHSKYGLNCS